MFGEKNYNEVDPQGNVLNSPAIEVDECLFTHLNG